MPSEMHGDATPKIFENARDLRKTMTEAEQILWQRLKDRQLYNYKFRRQHPISLFIADFYCHKAKLVIELDGGYHLTKDMKELDAERTAVINDFGITVLRFSNQDIIDNIERVLIEISTYLSHPLNPPLLK